MNYNLFDSHTVTQTMRWMCQILRIFSYQVKLHCWSSRCQFVVHALLKSCKKWLKKKQAVHLVRKEVETILQVAVKRFFIYYSSARWGMFIELIFTTFCLLLFFFSLLHPPRSRHLHLKIHCEICLMLLVVTYHRERTQSCLTSEVRSKVHLISFKPSWAPLWQGCGAITDTISPYSVVEKKKKKRRSHNHTSHAWQTRHT